MTTPEPREPWELPTEPQPIVRRRRVRPWQIGLGSVLALALLCGGGVAMVRSFAGGGKSNAAAPVSGSGTPAEEPTTAPTTTAAPTSAAPTTATPIPTTVRPTTVRPTTVRPTTVRPTTARPKPRPTPTTPTPPPTTKPPVTTKPTPTVTGKPAPPLPVVRAGGLCSPEGALAVTKNGKLVVCTPSPGDKRDRWHPLIT